MELSIQKFAKIKEANIKIEGITVIAGENNTGKSTIGKILFSCFNSFNNLEKEISLSREHSIRREILSMLNIIFRYKNRIKIQKSYTAIIEKIFDSINDPDIEIYNILLDNIKDYTDIENKEVIDLLEKTSLKVKEYIDISYEKIAYKKLSEYYKEIFNNQINSRIEKDSISEINIKDLMFKFKNDECIDTNLNYSYNNNIYLIDNPFTLDKNDYPYSLSIIESHLINNVLYTEEPYTIDKILIEEKLYEIYDKLSKVINGKIIEKDDEFYLEEDEIFIEPISVHNLSAGLKSFTIIKMLLERNALKEEDILILDEPEIHLHPKWQLLYAEIIVLLQKIFNIYILITTHSPYFLQAIEKYSKKHDIDEKTNYYLSDIKNKYSYFKLVNDNIEDIYAKMAEPIDELEN
ncbi:ABC transporter ATP-binding protein [Brachyspira hampsonii]|uniref:ABC transporter ATP-binding protein n=1 Tax=Brachyspira hampsonii TaxID=1287055 RepID=A0A1E5ND57_9SPIR|nr:AAA family ATPase [Brachyspira hampsonii]OEJ14041.1 ABC transporter ATP-binding protein [Brachyspira hampsonii]